MPPPDACTLRPSSSMLTFRLYPPVVVNFLHHITRGSVGWMVGKQVGPTVEVHDVFVIPFDDSDSGSSLYSDSREEKLKQYKMASPHFKVLGCYSTVSNVPADSDMQIHKDLMAATGGEFCILLNPAGSNLSKNELHMTIYEAVPRAEDGKSELIFVKSKCTVEAVSSEGISIHCDCGADLEKQKDTCFKNGLTFRRMLLETPSGFAMFNVAHRLVLFHQEIWSYFINPEDAHAVVSILGFIKVEDKSVAWKNDGPGEALRNFILKFPHKEPLIVQDMQLKYVIETNLNIKCHFYAHMVNELKWGINYIIEEFIPEEKDNMTKECLVSEQFKKKIKEYGLNIPLHMIDREFIAAVGHLYHLELTSKTYSRILQRKFGSYYYAGVEGKMSDLDFAKKVAVGLESKQMLPTDDVYSKEEFQEMISFILNAPAKFENAMIDLLRRVILDATENPILGCEPQLLDSEPPLQRTVLKPPGVVGLVRRYPHIAIICLGGCAIVLAKKVLS